MPDANVLSKFVNDWNEIIAFKITVTMLTNPDQASLTDALLAYLLKFDLDIDNLMKLRYSDLCEDRRGFKLQLTRKINLLYKVAASASRQNEFYYLDLLKPTAKKTTDLLRFLFNYLLFYNQILNEFKTKVEPLIKEKDDKLKEKNNLQISIDKEQCESINIEKRITEITDLLPKLNKQQDILKEKNFALKGQLNDLENSKEEIEKKFIELKRKENALNQKVIPNEQINKMLSEKSTLEISLVKVKNICKMETKKKIKSDANIEEHKSLIKQMEIILEHLLSEDFLIKHKLLANKLEDLSLNLVNKKEEIVRISDMVPEKQKLLDAIQNQIKVLQEKQKNEKTEYENKIKKIHKEIEDSKDQTEKLYEHLHEIEELIEEQYSIKETIDKAEKLFAKFDKNN